MKEYSLKDIDVIISRGNKMFTQREHKFLQSAREQLILSRALTYPQRSWVDSIEKKYSPEKRKEESEWLNGFDNAKRAIALQVAKYYDANPPYYSGLVHTILSNPETAVLTSSEWKQFCENKYSLKVRKIYEQQLKFKVADCVQIRVNNRLDLANCDPHGFPNRAARHREKNKIGFILEADAKPVTRTAKGSRIYKILLTGDTHPIYAHESDLKRKR